MKDTGVIDIHDREGRVSSAYKLLSAAAIPQESKELIKGFIDHKKKVDNIKKLREAKSITTLRKIAEIYEEPLINLKAKTRYDRDIQDAQKRLLDLLYKCYSQKAKVNNPNSPNRKEKGELMDNTKKDYYIHLKMFYGWMVNRKHPEEFDFIKIPKPQTKKPRANELLTLEEIQALCRVATTERDRLIVSLLFEGGMRIEEMMTLRIRDIEPKEEGAYYLLYVEKSKVCNGEEARRGVLVYDSIPALMDWLDKHPRKNDQDAPLFVHLYKDHNAMSYTEARTLLIKLREKAGITKKVNPHFFRKSATSYLRNKRKMNDASLKMRHGWKPDSRMLDIYASEDQEEADQDYLKCKDLVKAKNEEITKIEQTCKVCGTRNALGRDDCKTCRRPLNKDKIEDYLIKEERVKDLVQQSLEERLNKLEQMMEEKK